MKKSVFSICVVTLCVLILFSLLAYFFGSSRLDEHLIGAYSPQRTFKGNRPPLPNFRRPVDYVAWTNQYFAEGKAPKSAGVYDGFWSYHEDEECMPDPSKGIEKELRKLARGPTWESGEYPEVEAYMKSVAKYIKLFHQAANKREYCLQLKPDPETPNWGGVLPWTVSGKYAVYILLAKSWQKDKNQSERMYEAWQTGLKHASHLEHSRCLLAVMRGISIRLIIYQALRDSMHHNVIDKQTYKVAFDILTAQDPSRFSLTESLYCNWGAALGTLQQLYLRGSLNRTFAQLLLLDVDKLRRSKVRPAALVSAVDKYFVKLLHINHTSSPRITCGCFVSGNCNYTTASRIPCKTWSMAQISFAPGVCWTTQVLN
jgi:hypothetical protein